MNDKRKTKMLEPGTFEYKLHEKRCREYLKSDEAKEVEYEIFTNDSIRLVKAENTFDFNPFDEKDYRVIKPGTLEYKRLAKENREFFESKEGKEFMEKFALTYKYSEIEIKEEDDDSD